MLILKIEYISDYNLKSLNFFHWISYSISFLWIASSSNSEFIWPFNLTFDRALFIFYPNFNIDFRGQLLSKYKTEFNHFGLFRILLFLAFYWYINCKIWISFDWSIWWFLLRCSFRGFSDLWFSIIHSKLISYRKITSYISINFILSLVSKYIFWFSDFTELRLLVKVNALTLTFDFSLSNPRS